VQWLRADLDIREQCAGRWKAINDRLCGQVAHGIFGELFVFATARVMEEEIRGARDQHVFVALGMRPVSVPGGPRREKARVLWIAKILSDEANGVLRVSEPFAIACCAIEREERARHGDCFAQIGPRRIG
jgi:hypothetical protein